MAPDYELMRAGLEQAVPFNGHLGLHIAEIAVGRGVVVLPDTAALRNHVGSQHAGALFAVGHAAAGAGFVAAFVEQLQEVTTVAERATIEYRKIARGPITATAVLGADPEQLHAELARDGEVQFTIDVSLTDRAGDVVAEMAVDWTLRREP